MKTKQGLDDFLVRWSVDEAQALRRIALPDPIFAKARRAAERDPSMNGDGHHWSDDHAPAPRGKKLKDLMDHIYEPSLAIVPNVIHEGALVFAGRPKIGKSRLMLDIAVAVACNGKALGHLPVDAGPVLYLSLEDPERRLQERTRLMLADRKAPDCFEYETTWPHVDEGGLAELEGWIKGHTDPRLIVIDTLKRIRPKRKAQQGIYDADYEALQGLADLSHRYAGLAIVVVHHTNKLPAVDDISDLISGSTGLPSAADGFAVMRRKRGEDEATLTVVHRDLDDHEHALRSDPLTGGWTYIGPASEQAATPEQRSIVEVLLQATGPMSPQEVADVIGKKPAAVRFLMWKMAEIV